MRTLNEGADLPKLDKELRGIRWQDEDIRMRLHKNARVFAQSLAEIVTRRRRLGDRGLEVSRARDAHTVAAHPTEARERLTIGPKVTWLTLTLGRHRKQKGEGVLAHTGRPSQDQRMREAACGQRPSERLDRCCVAEQVVEGRGKRHHVEDRSRHPVPLASEIVWLTGK